MHESLRNIRSIFIIFITCCSISISYFIYSTLIWYEIKSTSYRQDPAQIITSSQDIDSNIQGYLHHQHRLRILPASWIKQEEEWIHSNGCELNDCVKHLVRPRTDEEFGIALNMAKRSIIKQFNQDFLLNVNKGAKNNDEEILSQELAFIVTPKDYLHTTLQHMIHLNDIFPNILMVYIIPAALFPKRELEKLYNKAKEFPNVLLADWPCSPVDRHHALKAYGSYFIPSHIGYIFHLNNDVFFVKESPNASNEGIMKALQTLKTSGLHTLHIITGEHVASKIVGNSSETFHNAVLKPPKIIQAIVGDSKLYFLNYKYEHEDDRVLGKKQISLGRSPYVEDHALLVRANLSRYLVDPCVSDDKEMYSLGLMASILSTTNNSTKLEYALQYSLLDEAIMFYIFESVEFSTKDKWDLLSLHMRRVDSKNTNESLSNLKRKFGFYIRPNRYSYLFGEIALHGVRIHFEEDDLELSSEEIDKLKVAYTISMLDLIGFTHFKVSGDQYFDLFDIYTNLYKPKSQSIEFKTLMSAKTISPASLYMFDDETLKKENENRDQNNWFNLIYRNLKQETNSLVIESFSKSIKKGFSSYAPLSIDPLRVNSTSIIWLKISKVEKTKELRQLLSDNVASLVFSNKDDSYDDFVLHYRWHTKVRYDSVDIVDIPDLQRKQCRYPKYMFPTNNYASTTHNSDKNPFATKIFSKFLKLVRSLQQKDLVHYLVNPFEKWNNNGKLLVNNIRFSNLVIYQHAPCTNRIFDTLNVMLQNLLNS